MQELLFPLGLAIGVLGGPAFPLDSRTSSSLSPEVGVVVGYRFDGASLHWQPELWARVGATGVLGPGVVVTRGDRVALGGYAHLDSSIFGYFFLPGADAGLALEARVAPWLTVSGRAGWEWLHPAHMKCGNCPQPSDQWVHAALGATAAF
jgi:hypothetical protein